MGHVGKAVNTVRKQEHRELMESATRRSKAAIPLALQPGERAGSAAERIQRIEATELKVGTGMGYQRGARACGTTFYPASGLKFWKRWYFWATHSRLAPMKAAAETVPGTSTTS